MRAITIGIVGGGPAGVSTFLHLKKQLQNLGYAKSVELLIFEKNNSLGSGTPYSSFESSHLINLSKIMMEPLAKEHHTFSQWLSAKEPHTEKSLFPPRHYFGEYLAYRAMLAKIEGEQKGMKINFISSCAVINIHEINPELFEVVTQDKKYLVNYVILSTGHMPSSNFTHLCGTSGYIHDPWNTQAYVNIPKNAFLGLIGSRLTAIDVALKFQAQGHTGKIVMVSRRGLLPTVKGKPCEYSPQYLNVRNLKKLIKDDYIPLKLDFLLELFWQEIATVLGLPVSIIKRSLYHQISALDWINKEIDEVQSGPRKVQAIFAHFYQVISKLWTKLSLEDQEHFLEEYFSVFLRYNCAFPLESASLLQNLLSKQQLEVYSGFIDVQFDGSDFIITLENKKPIKSKFLFNATGCGHDPETNAL